MILVIGTVLILQLVLSPTHGQGNVHPVFADPIATYSVFENFNTSSSINSDVPIHATDYENDAIEYYIPDGGVGYLDFDIITVNESTGWNGYLYFKSTITLDRESRDRYNVRVFARDNNNHGNIQNSYIDIIVSIKDINDVTPVITNLPHTVSISEDTNPNTKLYGVKSKDNDVGQNGVVVYSLLHVSPMSGTDKFFIYSSSGEIYLAQSLDYETVTQYTLTIEAQDLGSEPLKSTGVFTVNVTDVNDNPPRFEQTLYSKQIYENATKESVVLTVSAFDQDTMINDEIVYSFNSTIPPINGEQPFTINSTTGDIIVNAKLDADHETTVIYSLFVKAVEVNDPNMVAVVQVNIVVLDVNDNPPIFVNSTYSATLSELVNVGADVETVMAFDRDSGLNGNFQFKLVNLLNTSFPFNITASLDGNSGTIKLTGPLDYESVDQYKFEVLAVEVVNDNKKTATATVSVTITNENDNDPVFSQTEYFANVSENAMSGSFVTQVFASDNDLGTFGDVYYYLVNDYGKFKIHNKTGIITTTTSIDFEEDSSFSLSVVANDSARPPISQKTQKVLVEVTILDANDNGPVIVTNDSFVEINVEEDQIAGQLIFVVEAEDADNYPYNQFDYFLKIISPSNLTDSPFRFSSGARNQLVTKEVLDYETVKQYVVRVYVTDVGDLIDDSASGSSSGLNPAATYQSVTDLPADHVDYIDITVNVIDENDNYPQFVNGATMYSFNVTEEKKTGTFVGSVEATDKDSGLFGTVRYSISGVDNQNFTIDPVYGNITTNGPIDRERKDRFDLIVTAYDLDTAMEPGLSSTAVLTITIIDINDNDPIFEHPVYYDNDIVENTLTVNIPVSASDNDIGSNAQLTYVIASGNQNSAFVIDSSTGIISRNSSGTLDRETTPEFHLIVSAIDNGPLYRRTGNTTVVIVLQDVDDNDPLFTPAMYFVDITEDTAINSFVTKVTANDPDFGANGVVRYSLSGTNAFEISETTGTITTAVTFNYETGPNLIGFTLQAQDNGDMGSPGYAYIAVTILDINDNPPIFSPSLYSVNINEDIDDDTFITQVKATDADSGTNRLITYRITDIQTIGSVISTDEEADNVVGLFYVDSDSGKLYLSPNRSLDYESVKSYNVLITAVDGGTPSMNRSTVVTIAVNDVNDNSPVFASDVYNLTLSELTEVDTLHNILVSVSDEDSGSNALIRYQLQGTDVFTVGSSSGVLTLESSLDYETVDSLEFTIIATDSGIPSLNDSATVIVTVTDANDNDPVFNTSTDIQLYVYEGNYTETPLQLFEFIAEDVDSGVYGEITYAITSVSEIGKFKINSTDGHFFVISELDRETEDTYFLTITAKDGGNPPRAASTSVTVTVLDINEDPPYFTSQSYSFNINENVNTPTSLVTVAATDSDEGNNGSVIYSLSNDTLLSIDNKTGVIKSRVGYDYEQMTEFTVLVNASDEGNPPLWSVVNFTVTINDLNDNKPQFNYSSYGPYVLSEATTPQYSLVTVSATDEDSENNGYVSYRLENGKGRFSIDTEHGEITLVSSLDREVTDYYSLVVKAYDHGASRLTSTMYINVTVSDVNDNSPIFNENAQILSFSEGIASGSLLTTLTANDTDIGENGTIQFDIISGNAAGIFNITTVPSGNSYNGEIRLQTRMDYENKTSHILTIKASDMGPSPKSNTATVFITVNNINDNSPVFIPNSNYVFSISEVAQSGSAVGTVQATDADIGSFGTISSYSMAPDTHSYITGNFTISDTTGVISLSSSSSLDYEGQNQYAFTVTATDAGGLTSNASVTINILNYNDNQPTFDQNFYTANISENLNAGTGVIQVHATDNEGHGTISYSIVDGAFSDFVINSSSGLIKTNKSLDRESRATYVLRIKATDTGGSPLSGFAQVEIVVLDENDNAPQFPDSVAEYSLLETASIGDLLSPVLTATDSDIGSNSNITYHLTGEGVPSVFDIDSISGEITLQSTLNHELTQNYTFTLYAIDNGSTPLTSSPNVTITVIVQDFNDNAPILNHTIYNKTVNESFGSGNLLIQISATDKDQSGLNSKITYSILNVQEIALSASPFTINNQSGEIFTTAELDYEQYSKYTIIVKAEDNGTPSKSSSGTVSVTVLDVNDNGPVFSQSSYTHSVNEVNVSASNGLSLTTISAMDNDGTYPNNYVTFNITAGNDDNVFEINTTTGEIRAIKNLDYESVQMYTLTVKAQDNPIDYNDIRINFTQVTINILDVNDNSPIWMDTMHRVGSNHYSNVINETVSINTEVLYINATDKDSGDFGTVRYYLLTPTDKFRVDSSTGLISTIGLLDSDVVSLYNLTVEARDGGTPNYRAITGLVTITIIDVNDKHPLFLSSFYTQTISEDTDIDSSVITLTAVDPDSSNLTYSIIAGNDLNYFKIDSATGVIKVNSELDRETATNIQLRVMVTDNTFNATTNLLIILTDVNDNAPEFIDSHYYTNITENTVSGPVLLRNATGSITVIKAIDRDENSAVVYETIGPNKDYLRIDPSTGALSITSAAVFDYENLRTVDVQIKASDTVSFANRLSSNVTITINVVDSNDQTPSFRDKLYGISLWENTSINNLIYDEIEASDTDTGLGGEIEYSIFSSVPLLSMNLFQINSTNGDLTLVGSLDRETSPVINLTVMARDSITPFNSAFVSVIISLVDVNDNAPQFNKSIYTVSVPENLTTGNAVLTVKATDNDLANNRQISYKVLTLSDIFQINSGTGEISTKLPLDHETDPVLEFIVQACDYGNPMMCSNVTVIVNVQDLNDGVPQFDYTVYRTSVCNDTLPLSVVLHIFATDTDSGANGEVTYSIIGSLGNYFSFDNKSGQIFLKESITATDIGSNVTFKVEATDGGSPSLSNTTNVIIHLCNRESDFIAFNQSYYYGDLAENEEPPVVVATVSAYSKSGPVTYSIIESSNDLPFNISTSGEISTTQELDKEERDVYTLLLKAVDTYTGTNTAYATITVIVRDINDNPPLFLLTPYFYSITEEESGPVIIGTPLAIDPDQPFAESGVTYSLDPDTNPNGAFEIDKNNGTLTAIKPIDRETIDLIRLNILATDLDPQDQRVATATAVITVLDINDNKPIFNPSMYSVEVDEDVPPNFSIGRVQANDSDLNENQRVTYSIVSGSNGKFFIESNLGTISTANQLDYETTQFYNLTIKAQDAGNPNIQSAFTYFEIYIEDVNDCTPQFSQLNYRYINLPENSTIGTILFDINVTDCDSGENKNVTFDVSGGNSSVFTLHPYTGIIKLSNSLDYETTQSYDFEVTAIDHGTPSLFNLTYVHISIADVNDETPIFFNAPYSSSIPEDVTPGFILLTVSASDADLSSVNNALTFSFVSGNEKNHFSIHQTSGAISVLNSLDRETTDSYFLTIMVSDNGNPVRSADTTVSISLMDINDNRPQFVNLDPPPEITVKENSTNVSDLIFVVNARDDDIGNNGLLEYSLNNLENIFVIGPQNGEIERYGVIDYEEVKEFELLIQVMDSSEPFHTTHDTLRIVIEDINDNSPVFTESEYTGIQAEETDPYIEVIVTVGATDDDDTVQNSAITYLIIDCVNCGNETLFEINSTSGELTNVRKLDREQNSMYILTVMAINKGADPELNTTTNVYITVTDINDHRPVYNQTSYTASLSELIPDGSYVLTVLATDGDEPNTDNSEVHYTIATTIPNNPFRLEENTGKLYIAGSLDRETIPVYNFIIEASDRGSPTAMSTGVEVTLTLTDVNDQPPRFNQSTKTVQVSESTSSFPHLLWHVGYTDDDSDPSNKMSYYGLILELNGSIPTEFPLIYVNSTSGAVSLTGRVDYETTKSLSAVLSVNNSAIGYCDGNISNECTLSGTGELTIEVLDYNDNPPVLQKTSYAGQVSTEAPTGTQILQIVATDKDTQNDFATISYRLGESSNQKFRIDSAGWIITRGTFQNNDGERFLVVVEAYDNLGNEPSFTATATVEILAISDFKRVLVLFDLPTTRFTVDKESKIVQTLHNLTGYTIVVENIRNHVLGDSGEVDETRTDFIFHAIDPSTGEIVEFDVFIARLNIDEFFRLLAACNPVSITSLQEDVITSPVETIMIFLIVLCFILIVGALVMLVLACQQRYIALHSIMKDRVLDAFYGNPDPSLLEGGAMPRDFSGESFEMRGRVTKNTIYTDPYFHLSPFETSGGGSSVGDTSSVQQENPLYGEEELRFDLFQPPSDDETEGDEVDERKLLRAAIQDEDDLDDDDSATLI